MNKETAGSNKIIRATARSVITSGVIFVVGLYLIAIFMNNRAQFPTVDLESQSAVYTVIRTDGSTETFDQNRFSLVHYGETLVCEIAPIGEDEAIDNGVLVFSLYHCYVTIRCGDDVIYEQTEPEEGAMIGHRYYIIPLPDGYEDETITITAVCSEHDTFNYLIEPKIIPPDRTAYAFRNGHFATGILMITLLVTSIFMEITSAVSWILDRHRDGLLSISFLCSCVCLWYMGFSGYMQPFVESTAFLSVVEYIGLYLSAPALSFFIQNHTTSRKLHLFCMVETYFLLGFFVFVSVVTITMSGVSYVDYIGPLRIMLLFTLVLLLVSEFHERHVVKDLSEHTLHIGMSFTISLGAVELVRFLLAEQLAARFPWINTSITPVCILALVLTALMYYGVQLSANQYQRIEQENLKRLAFIDQLTGAPNRAACYQRMEQMKKNQVTDYVVTFIDINFLKRTNDTWGHDKGDELIRTASSLLKKHFVGDDFFGRWVGDEFIAVHFGTLEETRTIMDDISKEIKVLNESGKHDFTLSEAWGFGESTKEAPISPEEAVHRADDQMYIAKQKAHAQRK